MRDITIGEVAAGVSALVALVSGLGFLSAKIKKYINSAYKQSTVEITRSLHQLENRIETVDMESCKNYLVSFLAGVERGNPVDEIERERFWEQYGHYTQYGGNSYIKHKVEKLHGQGKL